MTSFFLKNECEQRKCLALLEKSRECVYKFRLREGSRFPNENPSLKK